MIFFPPNAKVESENQRLEIFYIIIRFVENFLLKVVKALRIAEYFVFKGRPIFFSKYIFVNKKCVSKKVYKSHLYNI